MFIPGSLSKVSQVIKKCGSLTLIGTHQGTDSGATKEPALATKLVTNSFIGQCMAVPKIRQNNVKVR